MTSDGNNFNDFPENQLTKFQLGGKKFTILVLLHYFNTICPRPKNGTFGVLGRRTMRPKYGTSRENLIRTGLLATITNTSPNS